MRHFRAAIFAVFFAAIASGCGLPKDIHRAGEKTKFEVQRAEREVNKSKEQYKSTKSSKRWAFLERYATRETWQDSFTKADADMGKAKSEYKKLEQILERNKKDDATKARKAMVAVKKAKDLALAEVVKPAIRAKYLEEVRDNAPKLMARAEDLTEKIGSAHGAVILVLSSTKEAFPNRSESLDKRFEPLVQRNDGAAASLAKAKSQLDSEEPDYAYFAEGYEAVVEHGKGYPADDKSFRTQMASLPKSYSKILTDARMNYFVALSRTSWDNGSDYMTDRDYNYPLTEVDEETFGYFEQLKENVTVATASKGWLGSKLKIRVSKEGPVNKAGLTKQTAHQSWPGRHSAAEYWIRDIFVKYYHQYTIVTDGKETKGGWQEVSEDVFEKYWDDVGMALMTKPYGSFDDEAIVHPTPPGLALVDNPKYGKWEDDGRGGRRWGFFESYLFYSMFFGPTRHYYGYNDYRGWNTGYRGRRAYYGGSANTPMYGTYGGRMRTRLAGSTFGRQIGGSRSSIRGAGARGRGGGPGGRGK